MCTARAPPIATPSRRSSSLGRHTAAADAINPLVLVLPGLGLSEAKPATLDAEQLSFKKVVVARPDVHHTCVVLGGQPTGQSLHEAPR